MATHGWLHWLQIAAIRETEAVAARNRLRQADTSDSEFGGAMIDEMHASMSAVVASACAIDALYGEIRPMIPLPSGLAALWTANHTSRPRRILETFKSGLRLGPRTNTWPREFRALYVLRDPITHHQIATNPSVPHPSGAPTHVAQEVADYCMENARRSVDLAFDVVLTALVSAKAPAVRAWADRMPHVPEVVRGYRPLN